MFRGVYAITPMTLTWEQEARAALLLAGRTAALCDASAAYLHGLTDKPPERLSLLLPHTARVVPDGAMDLRRTRRAFALVCTPSRTTLVDTVIDVARTATSSQAVVAHVTAAVRRGMRVEALLREVSARRAFANKATLLALLADCAEGMESVLEYHFQTRVVRPHGLPTPVLQYRDSVRGHRIRTDCIFDGYGVRAELDSEQAHPGRATAKDLLRDDDVLLTSGNITLRFRWEHVLDGACLSAAQIALALKQRGWDGEPIPCGPHCTAIAEYRKLAAGAAP